MSNLKDLKREKVKFAFEEINNIENKGEKLKEFKAHIQDIPMYIYTNGLIATLAFIQKKSKTDSSYESIKLILFGYTEKNFTHNNFKSKDMDKLIEYLINCNSQEYRRITLEVLSILEWLIKFSDAMLEGE